MALQAAVKDDLWHQLLPIVSSGGGFGVRMRG